MYFICSSGCKYLRLDLQGFYDEQIPPDIQEVEVEAILTHIQQSHKVRIQKEEFQDF